MKRGRFCAHRFGVLPDRRRTTPSRPGAGQTEHRPTGGDAAGRRGRTRGAHQVNSQVTGLWGSWYLLQTVQYLVRDQVAGLQANRANERLQIANLILAQKECASVTRTSRRGRGEQGRPGSERGRPARRRGAGGRRGEAVGQTSAMLGLSSSSESAELRTCRKPTPACVTRSPWRSKRSTNWVCRFNSHQCGSPPSWSNSRGERALADGKFPP